MIPLSIPNVNDKLYGGFWPRLAAGLIDGLIWMPVSYGFKYIAGIGKYNICYTAALGILLAILFEVYLVKKYGGTLGKLVLGLKVINTNGQNVGWKEPIMRYSVSFIFSAISSISMIYVAIRISNEQFYSIDILKRSDLLIQLGQFLQFWIFLIYAWFFSEFIVLLTNPRKRSIHDFIAKTVVIKSKYHDKIIEFQLENTSN